ncbi:MAG TPA: LacI family DNA-binding transcriptional regulator [Streptosporangiaceae bacterium]|jgi:LacI family transcriptional regulator|nr:LacI family DNA-binding transcriptional regulator [Streptosporangiaceae bacterium]
MAGRPTIRDVAELAGVHPGTASRALDPRREGRISAPTAERVRSAAKRLGYIPDPVARTLRLRRSAVVGVVVPDLANPVFPPIVQGIEDALAAEGYVALVANTGNDTGREHDRIAALQARRCDGYIVASATVDGAAIAGLTAAQEPVILVNRETGDAGLPSVSSDDRTGIQVAMRHLAGLGHRVIAHLTGPPNLSVVQTRAEAFGSAAQHLGLDAGSLILRHCPTLTASDARDAARALLAEVPAVTAVLAGNDLMALGCYSAAERAGRRCPEDISIVGYNDMPFVEWWRPALTTVRIPQYEIGREAARLLLEQIADGPRPPAKQVLMPVSLTVRSSTSRCPG